jgi:hypothetical protein
MSRHRTPGAFVRRPRLDIVNDDAEEYIVCSPPDMIDPPADARLRACDTRCRLLEQMRLLRAFSPAMPSTASVGYGAAEQRGRFDRVYAAAEKETALGSSCRGP